MEIVKRELTFTCSSGELLWGQAGVILQGAKSKRYDGVQSLKLRKGGTVSSSIFNYRVKAKRGEWEVYSFYRGESQLLYLVCAKDETPRSLYEKIKRDREEKDKDVIEVGRYSWGPTVAEEREDEERFLEECFYVNLLDPSGIEEFKRLVEEKALPKQDSLLCQGKGVRLYPEEDAEYEYGWLVFKGKELIGLFYDVSNNSPIYTEEADVFGKLEGEILEEE